jgi:hypothetical protein
MLSVSVMAEPARLPRSLRPIWERVLLSWRNTRPILRAKCATRRISDRPEEWSYVPQTRQKLLNVCMLFPGARAHATSARPGANIRSKMSGGLKKWVETWCLEINSWARENSLSCRDTNGEPIPHLYEAGELGSVYGFLYPTGGGNLSEMIAFGRIAGKNAAAEKPWQ